MSAEYLQDFLQLRILHVLRKVTSDDCSRTAYTTPTVKISVAVHLLKFSDMNKQTVYIPHTFRSSTVLDRETGIGSILRKKMVIWLKFSLLCKVNEMTDSEMKHVFYLLFRLLTILVARIFSRIKTSASVDTI